MFGRNTNQVRRAVCSAQFEKLLFRVYPEWRRFGRYRAMQDANGEERAFLYLHLPSGNSKVSEPLCIDTYPHSVVVSWFHGMHNHFDWQADYRRDAVEHIADVLNDNVTYTILQPNGNHIVRSWLGGHDAN